MAKNSSEGESLSVLVRNARNPCCSFFPFLLGGREKTLKKEFMAFALLSGLIPQLFLTHTFDTDREHTKPTYRCTAARE